MPGRKFVQYPNESVIRISSRSLRSDSQQLKKQVRLSYNSSHGFRSLPPLYHLIQVFLITTFEMNLRVANLPYLCLCLPNHPHIRVFINY